jgi:transcriptional regulator with XRE-family HTH domain
MDWLFLTDDVVIAELRQRCRRERLLQNMTQQDLAERSGVGINTVRRYERDHDYSPSLETFIRIIRVLGALDVLEQILPERPLDPLNPQASERRRARSSAAKPRAGEWTWGEQE